MRGYFVPRGGSFAMLTLGHGAPRMSWVVGVHPTQVHRACAGWMRALVL